MSNGMKLTRNPKFLKRVIIEGIQWVFFKPNLGEGVELEIIEDIREYQASRPDDVKAYRELLGRLRELTPEEATTVSNGKKLETRLRAQWFETIKKIEMDFLRMAKDLWKSDDRELYLKSRL